MPDPVETNPSLYSVAYENDRVRVLRYLDRPGDRTRPHGHPDSIMITLSAFDRLLVQGDRKVEVHLDAGEVRWLDAQEHSGENVGSSETCTLFIELKEPRPSKQPVPAGALGPA
jgi:beta-alanine degradation protein BauB